MKKLFSISLLIAVAVFACVRCVKTEIDVNYTIRAYVENEKEPAAGEDDPNEDETEDPVDVPLSSGVAYGFYLDSKLWTVASHDDALNGIVTSVETGEKKSYDLQGTVGAENFYHFNFTKKPAMIVLADKESKMYAWCTAAIYDTLDRMTLTVYFYRWSAESESTQGIWQIVNENPPPPEPEEPAESGAGLNTRGKDSRTEELIRMLPGKKVN